MAEAKPVALVTGGTDGIGREVVRGLVERGARVVVVGRSASKAAALKAEHPDVTVWRYDLSLMRNVDALVARVRDELPPLDLLVHSAGVMLRERTLTAEGLETVFAVQYLARYRLTHRLAGRLEGGVVVNISAGGAINMALDFDNLNGEKSYSGVNALQHESVANDMLMLDMAQLYPKVAAYCYGPWVVRTGLMRDMPLGLRLVAGTLGRLMSISAAQAADDVLALWTARPQSGLYGRRGKYNPAMGFRAYTANRERLRTHSDMLIRAALDAPA